MVFGLYAYGDLVIQGSYPYQQFMAGFEFLSNAWEGRVNFYLPQEISSADGYLIDGGAYPDANPSNTQFKSARGFELEGGPRIDCDLWDFTGSDSEHTMAFIFGMYLFEPADIGNFYTAGFAGGRVRVEVVGENLGNGVRFVVSGEIQADGYWGSTLLVRQGPSWPWVATNKAAKPVVGQREECLNSCAEMLL